MVESGETKGKAGSVGPPEPLPQALSVYCCSVLGWSPPRRLPDRGSTGQGMLGRVCVGEGPLPIKGTPTLCRAATGKRELWRNWGPGLRLTSLREELGVNEFERVFIHQARGALLQQEGTPLSNPSHPRPTP